jgi:ribonucleotide monophosphatase NagD (HAD superfamily)
MLATASGRTPINMGKPQTIMLDLAVEKSVSPAHLRVRARLSFSPPSMTLCARSAPRVARTSSAARFVFPCDPRASPDVLTRILLSTVLHAAACACLCRFKLDKSRVLMVGDRLDTDIAFGINGAVDTLLVTDTGRLTHQPRAWAWRVRCGTGLAAS